MRYLQRVLCVPLAMAGLLALPGFAAASEKACLLEGDFTLGGQRIVISDCAENRTMPANQFKEACRDMGNPLNDERYKARITYLAACPASPQAQCQNAMGGAMHFRYYKRDAEMLRSTRSSCESLGGRWVQ